MARRLSAVLIGAALAGTATAAVVAVPAAGAAPAADTVTLSPTGSMLVTYRGNGHGHGLSQYGAYGAALAGLSTAKIIAHYYPGTALTKAPGGLLRVLLDDTGSATTVRPAAQLSVTGVSGTLPTAGVARYRLSAGSGSTLTLQSLSTATNATYRTVRSGLANGAQFRRPGGAAIRVQHGDGTSTSYLGYVRAVRDGGGVDTVNVIGYNAYTAGVVPREMPASWSRAATDAQAVAARSYAVYEMLHGNGRSYDICASSSCQVYGGHAHYSARGDLLWTDFPQASNDTVNQVATYRGSVIFAQYSASNGGWSTSGGQPYLTAAADPYDPGRSGDPYVNATRTVSVASLARSVGLATVTQLVITERDGRGAWGGRVVDAVVHGTDASKRAATRSVDGYDLQAAFGLGTTWFSVARK